MVRDAGRGAGLLAGLEVNSLDTWDLARLGWLKVTAGNEPLRSLKLYDHRELEGLY